MDGIYTWIRNIVIYVILNTIIMNLLGHKSYKKYISVASGMILVLIVVSPLPNITNWGDKMDYYLRLNDFAVETSEFQNDLQYMEDMQMEEVFADYKNKIEVQLRNILSEDKIYLENFELVINRDEKSISFGKIVGMNIKASLNSEAKEKAKDYLSIEEIEKVNISLGDNKEKPARAVPSPMEIKIKNKLSDFYNIEPDNINISIQGG